MSGGGTIVWTDVCWLAAIALALAGAGSALLWRGRRGRLVGDHPHCRACGYDLSGLSRATHPCPECGTDLASDKAILIGRRTARPACLWAGGILLLLALTTAVQDARTGVRAWELEANRPVWWLRRQLTAAKPHRDRAYAELWRRLKANELWTSQMQSVAADLIGLRDDTDRPWERQRSGFINLARDKGGLDDAQFRRYVELAIALEATCRPRVRQGDSLPFRDAFGLHAARGTPIWYEYRLSHLEVSGVPIELSEATPGDAHLSDVVAQDVETFGPYVHEVTPDALARAGVKVGPQTLKLVFDIEGHEGRFRDDTSASRAFVLRTTVTRELAWTMLPPDSPSVEMVRSPQLEAAMHAALAPAVVYCTTDGGGGGKIEIDLSRYRAPVTASMSYHVRAGSREWFCGRSMSEWSAGPIQDFDAEQVDVVLRPDPELPVHTVDVNRIFGGELTFKDVPVRWVDRGRNPVPRPATRPR